MHPLHRHSNISAQDLIKAVSSVDQNLVKNIKVFDVYEGENLSLIHI